MTTEPHDTQQPEEGLSRRRRHHLKDEQSGRDNMFALRNTLNIIFMILAIVGVAVYYFYPDTNLGIYIIFAGMACKLVESCIRMLK